MFKREFYHELELLDKELEVNQIYIGEVLEKFPDFKHYIAAAMFAKPHEEQMPKWGMFFLDEFPASAAEIIDEYTPTFCDGKNTFGLRVQDRETIYTIAFDHSLLDTEILGFCKSDHEAVLIRSDKRLSIYHKGNIHICEHRIWRTLGELHTALKKMQIHYPDLLTDNFSKILEFAYYELSLRGIGATIVYWLDSTYSHTNSPIKDSFRLDFNTPSHQQMLKQYITYNDGAVIINRDNKILGGQTHLSYSDHSKTMVEAYSGTRHTSARRFSFDYPQAIIVTVSMDGPVSIFSDGCNIVTLDYTSIQPNQELIEIVREYNDTPATEEEYETACSNCGKNYHITLLNFPEWEEKKEVGCDVCGQKMDTVNCFKVDQILLKKLPA